MCQGNLFRSDGSTPGPSGTDYNGESRPVRLWVEGIQVLLYKLTNFNLLVDTPLSESRYSNYFDGWVEEHRVEEHDAHDSHEAALDEHDDEHDEDHDEEDYELHSQEEEEEEEEERQQHDEEEEEEENTAAENVTAEDEEEENDEVDNLIVGCIK